MGRRYCHGAAAYGFRPDVGPNHQQGLFLSAVVSEKYQQNDGWRVCEKP